MTSQPSSTNYPKTFRMTPMCLCPIVSRQSAGSIFWWLWSKCSPLPIPNREVKPCIADDTALVCGKVGRRQSFLRESLGVPFFFTPTPPPHARPNLLSASTSPRPLAPRTGHGPYELRGPPAFFPPESAIAHALHAVPPCAPGRLFALAYSSPSVKDPISVLGKGFLMYYYYTPNCLERHFHLFCVRIFLIFSLKRKRGW